jgi:putative ABC transport system permease protein
MKIIDFFEETYFALFANKVRSSLTILGIVIGIGSVIAMIAIGQGAQADIQSRIESLGSNLLVIMPGAQRGVGSQVSEGRGSAQTLTEADAEAIQTNIPLIKSVAPELSGRYQIIAKGANTNTSVDGVTSDYATVRNISVDQGSFISNQQVNSMAKVAVLGPSVRDDLFGTDANAIGQVIRIKQVDFRVVGVTQSKGGSGFNNQDDMIYIPLTTAQRYLAGSNYVSSISIEVIDQNSMTEAQNEITDLLLQRHHITNSQAADFSIMNQADIVAAASSTTNTFTVLLGSIAAISLLVGGIGIMNMMLTTVTERTREIGLRKAVGATRHDITIQFLFEATTLTFIGGILGILLGWIISLLITHFGGITTQISPMSIVLAFGVSAAIGIIFGFYPALKASKLNPIDALRYE